MMERQQILATMGELKLFGMKAAYDEIIKVALKRSHEPQQIVGDLLQAEISEKQARSIRYQMTIAKLPLAKDLAEFAFAGTPINEGLVRDLCGGEFLAHQRNVVLVGGTGTGKTHLAIAVARSCIRDGARARFYNMVDLVNGSRPRREPAGRAASPTTSPGSTGGAGRTRLPAVRAVGRSAAVPPNQPALRDHLDRGDDQPGVRGVAERVCRRRQDDDGTARSADPPLRDRRDRQRELALQEPA